MTSGTGRQAARVTVLRGTNGSGGFFLEYENIFHESIPACAFVVVVVVVFVVSGDQFAHINATLYARVNPQWLSELR